MDTYQGAVPGNFCYNPHDNQHLIDLVLLYSQCGDCDPSNTSKAVIAHINHTSAWVYMPEDGLLS